MLGDELGGLIAQLPRGLIMMTCVAGGLWLALMVYFAVIRPARRRAREAAERAAMPPPPSFVPYTGDTLTAPAASAAAELPDLDLLMHGHAPTPRRLGDVDVELSDGSIISATEVLVVLRDSRDGSLLLQSAGVAHSATERTPSRAVLESVLAELRQKLPSAPAASAPPAEPSAAPRPASTAEVPRVVPPPPVAGGVMPGDLPKFSDMRDEIKSRGAFRPYKSEMPPIPELNIPAAIEAYLQYKKSYSPEFAKRSIHVHAAPGGGVRIEVEGRYYDAVGDVEDADVRAFLQATIEEWQSRQ